MTDLHHVAGDCRGQLDGFVWFAAIAVVVGIVVTIIVFAQAGYI